MVSMLVLVAVAAHAWEAGGPAWSADRLPLEIHWTGAITGLAHGEVETAVAGAASAWSEGEGCGLFSVVEDPAAETWTGEGIAILFGGDTSTDGSETTAGHAVLRVGGTVAWWTDAAIDGGGCTDGFSLQGTLTHQVGHVLGLGHSCEQAAPCADPALQEATMYWAGVPCDTGPSTLGEDDLAGIHALYDPVLTPGAHCVADPTDGRTAVCAAERPAGLEDLVTWDFGDGAAAAGAFVAHTYAAEDVYAVRFCVDVAACGETRCAEDIFRSDDGVDPVSPAPLAEPRGCATVPGGSLLLAGLSALALLGACGGRAKPAGDGDTDTDSDTDSDADTDADSDTDTDADTLDIPPGTVLFTEAFDDADLLSRGWYDTSGVAISPDGHAGSAFQCTFLEGATGCSGGLPARHPIDETLSVYVSLWVKYEDGWVGSGQPYHPHEMHFVTNEDSDYVGPSTTHLTLYVEHVGGKPRLAMQDSLNVDPGCVLRNDDSFVGCDGDFASWPFTEARSAASCNGLVGSYDGRDCFDAGGSWYSSKSWESASAVTNGAWHFVEAYFELNTIVGGVGVPDGKVRYALDGALRIAADDVLLRTGAHEAMRFDQFLMLPYIGDGSPIEQTLLYDDLTVATGKP
jgi:hypothetical protein